MADPYEQRLRLGALIETSRPDRVLSDAMRAQFKDEIDAGFRQLEASFATVYFGDVDPGTFVNKRTRWQRVTQGTRCFVNGWRERIAHWIWPYGWDDGY